MLLHSSYRSINFGGLVGNWLGNMSNHWQYKSCNILVACVVILAFSSTLVKSFSFRGWNKNLKMMYVPETLSGISSISFLAPALLCFQIPWRWMAWHGHAFSLLNNSENLKINRFFTYLNFNWNMWMILWCHTTNKN